MQKDKSGWQLFLVDFKAQSWEKNWNGSSLKQGENYYILNENDFNVTTYC